MGVYGYQPKTTCNSCTKRNDCKKYKENKNSCKLYDGEMPKPPTTWTPPAFRKPTPMPEVKPAKQRTVLSIRDFAILYELASRKLTEIEANITTLGVDREEANHNPYYQDLLRIRDKLGELNIEVETPIVEMED
jgi:hypothetical protein